MNSLAYDIWENQPDGSAARQDVIETDRLRAGHIPRPRAAIPRAARRPGVASGPAGMPAGPCSSNLAQLTVNGLITGTILALTGVGATLVFGIQRIANFAHGEYLTFAAYVGLLLNAVLRPELVVATLGAMAATALLAVGASLRGAAAAVRPRPGRDCR